MKYNKANYNYMKILSITFMLCASISTLFAQSTQVTGTVTNTGGEPIGNAAIIVTDNFKQFYTDTKGTFSVEVYAGDILRFSKENYESQEVQIDSVGQILNVVLNWVKPKEVIKVGYTDRDKYNLTSAVSTVRSTDITRAASTSPVNAITGKGTGLTVMRNSGNEPGYELSSIYIRGIGTFGQYRAPLVLVDDFERDFNKLDLHEIESVSILKDGAANAQYGQRGANGTLLVTTKRGIAGKPEIEFISQFGIQQVTNLPEFLGSQEYLTLYRKALTNDGSYIPTDQKYNPAMYNGTQDQYTYPNVNWHDSFLKKTAPQQQYKISFRGGTDIIKYFVLFGYLTQEGILKHANENPNFDTNIKYDKYNIRSNFDVSISKNLTVSLDIAGQIENRNTPNSPIENIFDTLSTILPYAMPIKYADGKLGGTSVYKNNPLGMIGHRGYIMNSSKALQMKAQGIQKLDMLLPGLSANLAMGYDAMSAYAKGRSASYTTYEQLLDGTYVSYGQNKDISLGLEKFDKLSFYQYMLAFHGGFSYNKDFGVNSILADVRYYQSQIFTQGDNPAYARQGINAKATYSYNQKYVAEFSFSYDGSEEFAPGKQFGFFPAISAAWVMSNETFMKESDMISFMKLRASYGQTGNSKHGYGRYAYQSHWSGFDSSSGGYVFGGGFNWGDGAWEGRPANPNLTWETSHNLNFGIDAELFSNLTLQFDLFRHDRNDIITEMSATSSSVTGAPLPYVNYGSVLNQGFELSAMHRDRVASVINYFVQGNVSFAKNKITKIDEIASLADYQKHSGKSVTQLWGLEHIGFYADAADIANSPASTFYGVKPGDIKYKNQNPNEDNIINEFDEVAVGFPTIPEWVFSLSFGFDYKGFDFSTLLTGVANRSVYLNNAAVWGLQDNNNATKILYGAWEQGVNETNATYPRLTTENNLNNYRSSSFWIKNGNFLRVSNIELGYQLPQNILQHVKIKQLRLYVNAQNLLSLDHLKEYNLDPELPEAGITGYPNMRTYNIGLNVKF